MAATDVAEQFELLQIVHPGELTSLGRARRLRDGNVVWLEIPRAVSARATERLRHELEVAHTLDRAVALHPVEVSTFERAPVLVLEDFSGTPLGELLTTPIELGQALQIASAIATSLVSIHRSGVVHRDISPEHILYDARTGAAKLAGFGIASTARGESWALTTRIEGSLPYISPEQTGRLDRPVDTRSDLYSLGVVLYEMLMGSRPFEATDVLGWVHCHVARLPMPPAVVTSRVPLMVSDLVMKLLAKLPEDRYQTAAGLAADLRRCAEEWNATGTVAPFELGGSDVSDQLRIPRKLYGRRSESAVLETALREVAARGVPHVVLITGPTGSGKSLLARSLEEPVVRMGGIFASGTFVDQGHAAPYSAIARALHEVVAYIQCEGADALAAWRKRFADALGPIGQVVIDLVPSLETIVGPQPPVPELPLPEVQARFNLVVRRFISVLATTSHMLVLFLDDLHAADDASLELLAELASHPDTGRLLVIGAYRDDAVALERLRRFLARLRASHGLVDDTALGPLTLEDVTQLCADTLSSLPARTAPLAQLVWARTSGNPLAVTQLLTALHHDHLVVFDPDERMWRWGRSIARATIRDDVVERTQSCLKALGSDVREVIELGACLGIQFDLHTLALAAGASPDAALAEAAELGLISSIGGDRSRFVHETIHEAIYNAIPEARRVEVHLHVGRLLLDQLPQDELDSRVFEVARHLNAGISLVQDPRERARIAEVDLRAGRAAAASTGFAAASSYLATGIQLIDVRAWHERFELVFALHLELARCELAQMHLAEVERLTALLRLRVRNATERRVVERLEIDVLLTRNDASAAVSIAVGSLAPLGIQLTPHPTSDELAAAAQLVWQTLGDRTIDSLVELPLLTDPELVAALEMLGAVLPSAYLTDPNLHCLVAARMCTLAIRNGVTGASALGFAAFALELESTFHRPDEARRCASLALRLTAKHGFPGYAASSRMLVGFGATRLVPLREALEIQRSALRTALDAGDLAYAGFASSEVVGLRLVLGDPLDDVAAELSTLLRDEALPLVRHLMELQLAYIQDLRGESDALGTAEPSEPALPVLVAARHLRRLQAHYFHGDFAAAAGEAERVRPLEWSLKGQLRVAEFHFFAALSYAALADLPHLLEHQEAVRDWAEARPENFGYMASLVDAEHARLADRTREAIRLFEQAIHAALDNGFANGAAIALERAASFYRELGLDELATGHLARARDQYAAWGALAKLRELEMRLPARGTPPAAADRDLVAPLRISQLISSEMVRPRLLATLLQELLQQAGARKAAFISTNGGGTRLECVAGPIGDVPASIINQVKSSRRSVLLHDATFPGPYSADPYVAQERPRSVLCMPMVRHDELIGLVYLENDLLPGVFSKDRLVVLELLVEQAAISLENARLYGERGRQIAERQQAEATLRSVLDNIVDGVFLCDRAGRMTFMNAAGARLVGVRTDEHPSVLELAAKLHAAHPLGLPLAPDELPLLRALAGEIVSSFDMTVRDPRTERATHLRVSAAPLQDEKGAIAGALAVVINVTESTELEHLKEQFVRAVAHELKTPLTIVKGYADVLRSRRDGFAVAQRSVLDALVAGADRIDRLVTDVLILWQLQTGRLSLASEAGIDLVELVSLAAGRLHPDRARRVSIHAPRPLLITADRQLLGEAISDLLDNALRYSPAGSPVTVEAGSYDDRVFVAVTDRGIGIPRDKQTRLFEPFFRAHADTAYDTGGLGLGLYTAKAIALLHGGAIEVETEEGRGSTFRLVLPVRLRM